MIDKLKNLKTEKQNVNSNDIDQKSINEILSIINNEDHSVSLAIKKNIHVIEKAVILALSTLKNNGRVFYIGSGTSGRLGVLDASEIPPTFSAPNDWFIGIIAGGDKALRSSIENAEDNTLNSIVDLKEYSFNSDDLLIGISCSGASQYVISALDYGISIGSKTIYLVTNPKPLYKTTVDLSIKIDTGPEIITGSTRMKGGTATKFILNMISTATMIRLGKVYGNLMVDLKTINKKLILRAIKIIIYICKVDYKTASRILSLSGGQVKVAIIMIQFNCDVSTAKELLIGNNEQLRGLI